MKVLQYIETSTVHKILLVHDLWVKWVWHWITVDHLHICIERTLLECNNKSHDSLRTFCKCHPLFSGWLGSALWGEIILCRKIFSFRASRWRWGCQRWIALWDWDRWIDEIYRWLGMSRWWRCPVPNFLMMLTFTATLYYNYIVIHHRLI